MSDKLQQGVNVVTSFVGGESPSSNKLSSISAQLKNATQKIEQAIGDIHDQSYPYSSLTPARLALEYGRLSDTVGLDYALTRALDIANLARLIGPASNLNPEFHDGGQQSITENVPASTYAFCLRYPPDNISTVSFSANGSGEAFQVQQTVGGLATAGDYYINNLGEVFCTQMTDATAPGTVTYTTTPNNWKGGTTYLGSRFNVLPDPNQLSAGGSGCSIGAPDSSGRRAISIPVCTCSQMNGNMSSVELDNSDFNYQVQLQLPEVLVKNYTSGETIPGGFIYLKNWTTGELYDTATYIYNSSTSVLISGVDITAEVDAGHIFYLITVGTNLTTAIDDLRRKSKHTHDRSYGEPEVNVLGIAGWTNCAWSNNSFVASNISGNYAPQYLHRYGYQAGENTWNDKNAFLGDFVLAKSGASEGAGLDITGESYRIYFGSLTGPAIWNDDGHLYSMSTSGFRTNGSSYLYNTFSIYVTSTYTDHVGMYLYNNYGHIEGIHSGINVDCIAAGPQNSSYSSGNRLDLWAIDENGSTDSKSTGTTSYHYATTQITGTDAGNDGWKVPVFQVVHYAQWERTFSPKDNSNSAAATWADVACWQTNIKLPHYLYNDFANNLGGDAVIGMQIMVQAPGGVANRWWSSGGSARYGTDDGERIIAFIDRDNTSESNNEIQILIAADGNTNQNFHYTRFMGGAGSGDPPSTIPINIKILLFVAGPTDSNSSILNMIP